MTEETDTAPTIGDTAPAPAPAPDTVTLTGEEVAALKDRLAKLEQGASTRPLSTKQQLQAELDAALGLQHDSVEARKTGRDVADAAATIAIEARDELRARDIKDAATAAGFYDPTDAVTALAGMTGDPAELVADLAKGKAHWVRKTTERDPVGPGGAPLDPELVAYAAEIQKSQRR